MRDVLISDFWYGFHFGVYAGIALYWMTTWPVWKIWWKKINDKLDEWADV